jgi:hypothetical protein
MLSVTKFHSLHTEPVCACCLLPTCGSIPGVDNYFTSGQTEALREGPEILEIKILPLNTIS